jgi:hypothetical protein
VLTPRALEDPGERTRVVHPSRRMAAIPARPCLIRLIPEDTMVEAMARPLVRATVRTRPFIDGRPSEVALEKQQANGGINKSETAIQV